MLLKILFRKFNFKFTIRVKTSTFQVSQLSTDLNIRV